MIKINNILMEYFYKSKLMQKSHDEQNIKLLNEDRISSDIENIQDRLGEPER